MQQKLQLLSEMRKVLIFRGELSRFVNCRSRSNVASKKIDENYSNALPFSSIPGPKGLPYLGNWVTYKLDPDKIKRREVYLKYLYQTYGSIVKETYCGKTVLHLFDPDHIQQVYETEGKYPHIPPLLAPVKQYRSERDFAPGLGNSNGPEWYRIRSVVQKVMMRPQKTLDYLPSQNLVSDDFISKMDSLMDEKGEIPNFNRWVSRWALESSANTCFDMRMGYLEDSGLAMGDAIIDANWTVFDLSLKLGFSLPIYTFLPTPGIKTLYKCEDFLMSEGERLLEIATKKYKKEIEAGTLTEKKFSFLSYMLSSNISDKDILPVVNSVLTDTLSTTSQAVLFNLYTLANNPRVQEKAREEARQILNEGHLTADGFASASYIKACMKETFRCLPVGLDIQRLSNKDLVIGGYQIPEGTFIALQNFLKPHDPEYVSEPEKFLPERWTRDEVSRDKLHPYILTPFSVGTRMCAGRRFAEQELVMMISKILAKYHVEWHYGKLGQFYRLLQIPDQEVKITFKKL